jgi:ABC-type glycerol-3-phosphate transport system substrate-binding protein
MKICAGFLVILLVMAGTFCGCGKPKQPVQEFTILIRMMPEQQKFFQNEVIAAFEKSHQCKINIATFDKMWDIQTVLELEAKKDKKAIALVKVPFEMTRVLVGKQLMKPIDEVVTDPALLDMQRAEYHQLALGLGYVDGRQYYVPRKLETRILFFLGSKVDEAVREFPKYKADLNKYLKTQNGYGLPRDYQLESDPEEWDTYDLFVLGFIWKSIPYDGVAMGRIAHRGEKYEGTALDLIDRSIQQGAETKDLLEMHSPAVVRMLEWETEFVQAGIFNAGMWNDPWRGSHMYQAFSDGKIFLTNFQQIDCFLVHGWEESVEMPGYLKNPADMRLATMPKAVSLALDKQGNYLAMGTKKVTTGGWWWGIPATAPYSELAYELARYITSREVQAIECSRFGQLPVRKDILNNIDETFTLGWVGDIFRVSLNQVGINDLTTIPLVPQYGEMCKVYLDAWYEIAIGKKGVENNKVSNSLILNLLGKEYAPKVRTLVETSAAGTP